MIRREEQRAGRQDEQTREAPYLPPRAVTSSHPAFGAIRTLATDFVTAEVVDALRREGVRAIVLKGPSLTNWLYEDAFRPYLDSDLLVDPLKIPLAEQVLSTLGFHHPAREDIPHDRPWHAHFWIREGWKPATIDLHRTLIGAAVTPQELWLKLSQETERMRLAGLDVEILNLRARALHVALHAASDGIRHGRPLEDLSRALERTPDHVWQEVAELAKSIDALPAFSTGLRLLPAGEALATRLQLPAYRSVELALRASETPPLSLGFEWLSRTPGLRHKAAFVARKLVPPPSFMRAWSPRAARGGRVALAAAYLWRPVWLALHVGPGVRAWWRARQQAN